jgi:hypothetical protein
MTILKTSTLTVGLAVGLAMGLTGCTESQVTLSPDFGRAVHEDLTAQIADPDAHYVGKPAPGSEGHRVGLAQQRYDTGKVIKPAAAAAYVVGSASSDGGSGGDPGPAPAAPTPGPTPQ